MRSRNGSSGSRTRVSAKLAPSVGGVHLSIMIPLGTSMKDIRIGRLSSAASAGVMASSTGSASVAPAPRRNVRRGIDFLVMTDIAGPPHLEWRAVDDAQNDGRPPIIVRSSSAHDLAKNRVVVLFHTTTQCIGHKPLGHGLDEHFPFADQDLTQPGRTVELGAVGE